MKYDELLKVCEKVEARLNEMGARGEVWAHSSGLPVFDVQIDWGDWKHDHLRVKWIVKEMGGVHIGSEVVEEDGSDCYSAIHHFAVGNIAA